MNFADGVVAGGGTRVRGGRVIGCAGVVHRDESESPNSGEFIHIGVNDR